MTLGFFSIFNSHARRGSFFQCSFCSILGVRQLVLENGAFQPPKGFVLQGFYVEMLLWLEAFSLNRAPVLGGARFFNAISSASISDRLSDRLRLRSKKVSKKVSKRNRN